MDMNLIDEIVSAVKPDEKEKNHTYSAVVSRIDDEGVVWVNLVGSEKETPTAETSAEVKKGDRVNVEWRNNKIYISGNVSNPSAGVVRVSAVENAAQVANQAAANAVADASVARSAAESAQADASIANEQALIAQQKADSVEGIAQAAQQSANDAQTAAEAAQESATQAIADAESASTAASTAQAAADRAQGTADTAQVSANQAIADAGRAQSAADTADENARAAQQSASSAQTSATQAVADAAVANTAANNAGRAAAIAQAAAEAAQGDIDEMATYFWHDSEGAHVLGDTYRTDIKDGLEVVKNSDGTVLADINPDGVTFKSGNGTEIAHLGYGTTQGESGETTSPYYDLGIRTANTTIGAYSVAEGDDTTASGNVSHAEGSETMAIGQASHTEGSITFAGGDFSHAEGYYTEAIGESSHTEGERTQARGDRSHAEGWGTASSGYASHAEGEYTVASGRASHAQGKYNVDNSNHADIVGNGTESNPSGRSNAYALDWNGNGYYMGDVYVGCNANSSGGTKLAKVTDCPFPVNGIYMSMDSANPSIIWEGTTWQRISQGRVLIGVNESDTDFNSAGKTGGEKTHKLTKEESGLPSHGHGFTQPKIPNHQHALQRTQLGIQTGSTNRYFASGTTVGGNTANDGGGGACTGGAVSAHAGADASTAHNNLQPYLTCYIWQRTA